MPDTRHAPRNKFKWLTLALALTAAMLIAILSACGGDDDDDAGDDGGEATPTATQDSSSGDGEATPTPQDGGDDGDDGDDDTVEALNQFADDFERFTGMIKYEIKDFSGTDAVGLSSMTIYQSDTASRIDIESADGDAIFIDTPDASYMCTEGQCLKYPAGEGGGGAGALTSLIDPSSIEDSFGDIPDGIDVETSKEKIAGIEATCFSAEGDLDEETPGDEAAEVCFAEGGLMLRMVFASGEGSGTFEATEASTSVSDSDFEPPFEVTDLSELGQ